MMKSNINVNNLSPHRIERNWNLYSIYIRMCLLVRILYTPFLYNLHNFTLIPPSFSKKSVIKLFLSHDCLSNHFVILLKIGAVAFSLFLLFFLYFFLQCLKFCSLFIFNSRTFFIFLHSFIFRIIHKTYYLTHTTSLCIIIIQVRQLP